MNDPVHVRNAPEKIFVTEFDGLMPPTLITSDRQEILAFRADHKDIIVKPLFGNGGAGVFHIQPGDENLNSLLELFTQLYREPVIVQRYLPEGTPGRQADHPHRRHWRLAPSTASRRRVRRAQHACRRQAGEIDAHQARPKRFARRSARN